VLFVLLQRRLVVPRDVVSRVGWREVVFVLLQGRLVVPRDVVSRVGWR
jgi:hypothetical protein